MYMTICVISPRSLEDMVVGVEGAGGASDDGLALDGVHFGEGVLDVEEGEGGGGEEDEDEGGEEDASGHGGSFESVCARG